MRAKPKRRQIKGGLDLKKFHAAICEIRAGAGLTETDAAEQAGVHRMTLSRMDSYGYRPSADSLMRLLKWSGLKAEDFHYGE